MFFLSFQWTSVMAFPVTSLSMDRGLFERLKVPGMQTDVLATSVVLPHLQRFFTQAENAIAVNEGDVEIQASLADVQVDDDCRHRIKAEAPKAIGSILGNSSLSFGIAWVPWDSISVFADVNVNAKLNVHADVSVRTGEEIFGHHCTEIARKTVGVKVLSGGRTGIGLRLTAKDAHVAKVDEKWCLMFRFHASVVGRVLSWNVDKVRADHCKIEVLGIKIGSVCGIIERLVKDQAQKFTKKVTQVKAPELLQRLEDKINTSIGSQVAVPLEIGQLSSLESLLLLLFALLALLLILVPVLGCRRCGGWWHWAVVVACGCFVVLMIVLLR